MYICLWMTSGLGASVWIHHKHNFPSGCIATACSSLSLHYPYTLPGHDCSLPSAMTFETDGRVRAWSVGHQRDTHANTTFFLWKITFYCAEHTIWIYSASSQSSAVQNCGRCMCHLFRVLQLTYTTGDEPQDTCLHTPLHINMFK